MTKLTCLAIASIIDKKCLSRETMLEFGAETRRKVLGVLREYADIQSRRWPFVNPHQHCLSYLRDIEHSCGELGLDELIAAYEDEAKRYVNDAGNH